MATPAQREQIPTRVLTEYSGVGGGRGMPPQSAGVPAPTQQSSNPFTQLLYSDRYTWPFTITNNIPATSFVTITQQIPLTDVPTIQVPGGYYLHCHAIPWVQHSVSGLLLQSITATPIIAIGSIQQQGDVFIGPVTASGFAVKVVVSLWNATGGVIAQPQQVTLWVYHQVEYSVIQ